MATLTERLILLIDSKSGGAIKDLRRVQDEVDKLGDEAGRTGTRLDGLAAKFGVSGQALKAGLVTAAGAAGYALFKLGKDAVEAASALEEQTARITTLFGDASDAVIAFAESANNLGLSDRAALQAAGTFGTLFTNIGQTDDAAAQMSIRMVQLAADLASFNDTSLEDALTAINSGLVGETEPLRRFGVLLNEATLKNAALRDGLISSTTQALAPGTKALVAYNEILAQTTTQQGDVERTGGSLANQQRQLTGNIEDLNATLGEQLLPIVTDLVTGLNAAVQATISFYGALGDLTSGIPYATEAFKGLATATSPFLLGMKLMPTVVGAAADALGGLGTANDAVLESLQANRDAMVAYYGAINQARTAQQQLTLATNANRQALDAERGAFHRITSSIREASIALQEFRRQQHITAVEEQRAAQERGAELLNQIVNPAKPIGGAIGGSIGGGIVDGLEDSQAEIEAFLRSIAQKAAEDMQDAFGAIGARLNISGANDQLTDATNGLAALRQEASAIAGDLRAQQQLVGDLVKAAGVITPEEQVAIEQAEENLERIRMAYLGLREVVAPSSFSGEDTIIEQVTPTATLAELQLAEQRLAEARARATGPTRELEEAQRRLDDLRERQLEIPGLIADAERRLEQAQLGVVEAQLRLIDTGASLADQNADFIDQFREIATNAGLSAVAVDNLVGSLRAAATAAGLEDVFGNGQLFRTHADAEAIRNFISAQAGLPAFGSGGVVPGPIGSPQLVMAHAGETILPTHRGGGVLLGGVSINVSGAGDPTAVARAVRNELLRLQRYNGRLGFN